MKEWKNQKETVVFLKETRLMLVVILVKTLVQSVHDIFI